MRLSLRIVTLFFLFSSLGSIEDSKSWVNLNNLLFNYSRYFIGVYNPTKLATLLYYLSKIESEGSLPIFLIKISMYFAVVISASLTPSKKLPQINPRVNESRILFKFYSKKRLLAGSSIVLTNE